MNEKSVKEYLKDMTFKEKCSYLFGYYKFHALGFATIALLIGIYVHGVITSKDTYLNVTYIGSNIPMETNINIANNLNELLVPDDDKQQVTFEALDPNNYQTLSKLQALTVAGDIDVAIIDRNYFDENYSSEIFLDLNSINGFSSLQLNENSLLKYDDKTYGIDIKDMKLFSELNNSSKGNYLVMFSNSKNTDKLIELLNICGINQ